MSRIINYCSKVLLLLFFISSTLKSQDILSGDSFGIYSEDFTQSAITTIFKDNRGFMWFGTYGDGLYKYDSYKFIRYKKKINSDKGLLNSSIILSFLIDNQNDIWVGTHQGLNKYNEDLDRFENINLSINDDVTGFEVNAIVEFNDDYLLLGINEYGIYKFDKNNFTLDLLLFNDLETGKELLIEEIVKTKNGRFLIATTYGVLTFDPYTEILHLAEFKTDKNPITISNSIISLLITDDNAIWIGTSSNGILRLHEKNQVYSIQKHPISRKRIMSMAQKDAKTVIVATENDGLFVIDFISQNYKNYQYSKLKQNTIKSNSIWSLYTDESDRIWLGYYNNGVDIYDPNYNKFKAIKSIPYLINSLNSNSVTSIERDRQGRFWIALLDGGVDVYDIDNKKFTHLYDQTNKIATGLDKLDIQTIFIDSKNNKWVGTWDSGLYLLENNKKKFININANSPQSILKSNRIMSFDEDSEGNIWIGSFFGGVYTYNLEEKILKHYKSAEFKKFDLDFCSIRKLIVDHEENIWLATRNGVYKIEKTKNQSFKIHSLNTLMDNKSNQSNTARIINSLFEDHENNIWIGTLGYGLFKFNPKSQSLDWYNEKNGLFYDKVSFITQDNSKHIWIGGNDGLSKLDLNTQEFTYFNKKDGLLSNDFNFNSVYKSSDGLIYFGNSKGINYFNPSNIIYNQTKPKVYISNLKIFNEEVNPNNDNSPLNKVISKTQNVTLKHNQSVLAFDFIGINYTRSEINKYAYYLEGLENDWNYVGNTTNASYKNIPPGNYTFKVKAANNDGLWNDKPTTLKIEILPPWWKTITAYLAYFALLILITYFTIKITKKQLKERQLLQFEREKHRQFEALNDKKIQFFTNISHEFRTPITLIFTPVADILDNLGHQLPEEVKEKLTIIRRNANRLSRLINELMDFRKLQFNKMTINASLIDVVPFVEEIVSHFSEEALQKNILLSIEYEDDDLTIWADPSMLEKIVFNLLSNAFKATLERGLITVMISRRISNPIIFPLIDNENPLSALEIIIKDTGNGIKKENLHKVFDRFQQADELNDQYYGGTGIGLELVKSFVELHKGKVILQSKVNHGTQFKLYFPLGHSHLGIQELQEKSNIIIQKYSESKNSDKNEITNSDERIANKKVVLIVEDSYDLRTYLKNELSNDYIIKEAQNGEEGLEKVDKFMPDLIITDVMMPLMDGFELCEKIKNNLKTSHIPLLMITAKGLQVDKVKGIDSGADVYLNKPFNMEVLRSHLKQLITSRQVLFDRYLLDNSVAISSENTTSLDKEFIDNVLVYINENISDENLNVENLAEKMLLSRSKLYRKIKALTGYTANEFIRKIRLGKAKKLLENSEYSISEICYKVGFSSPSYFSKCFKDYFGKLPKEMRDLSSSNSN